MSYSQIKVESLNHVARVTINRPAQRNALSAETIRELIDAFTNLSQDSSLRCIVLTGSGTEAYCAGADLHELQSRNSPTERRDFFASIATLITTISNCPVPVISVVHGFALAGGLGLVAASDIVLAADDAVFGLPEVMVGLAAMTIMLPLAAIMSSRTLSYLALSGERITAQQAYDAGLVTRVLPKLKIDEEAQAVCIRIANNAPHAIRTCKAALREIPARDRTSDMLGLADRSALLSLGLEATEGIAAFQEKRPPSWKL
jgi:methylglutaconyl-CoA hydratase